ncbi:MAG: prephenate dehydrogenase/arogenate dehydrogenase family protein [Acidobacteriota bacterium]
MEIPVNTVGIAGFGRFGRSLAELMAESGIQVRAYDPATPVPAPLAAPSLAALISASEVIVLAVPVPALEDVVAAAVPFLTSRQMVLDVASVKVKPTECFERHLAERVPWVATHPLFGPASLARRERPLRVVVCPNARHPGAVDAAARLYRRLGCRVRLQDAEAHDREMARTHALGFLIAKAFIDLGISSEPESVPPSFRGISATIESVREDAGHLFTAILRDNPYAAGARRDLLDALARLDEELSHPAAGAASAQTEFPIPDLGGRSPDLVEVRDLIDDVDRRLVELLVQRQDLAKRAGHIKRRDGRPVRDAVREDSLLAERAGWARDGGLEVEGMLRVFRAILDQSRSYQSASDSEDS